MLPRRKDSQTQFRHEPTTNNNNNNNNNNNIADNHNHDDALSGAAKHGTYS